MAGLEAAGGSNSYRTGVYVCIQTEHIHTHICTAHKASHSSVYSHIQPAVLEVVIENMENKYTAEYGMHFEH